MFFRGSSALRNVARRAGEVFEELGHPRLYGEEKSGDLVGSGLVAEFAYNSATFGLPCLPSFGAKLLTRVAFGRVRIGVLCHHGCSSLLDG